MTYEVDLIRGSAVYSLSDGNPFWAMTLTGLGLPPVRLTKERSPQQDGSTVVGSVLDERLLNLALLIDAPNEATAAVYRRTLAKMLKPIKGVPCTLRVTENDGGVRQIDTYTVGTVDFPNTNQDRFAGKQNVVVQLEAPDPIPYDPTLQNIVFDTHGGGGYQVPLSVPFVYTVGDSINGVAAVTYAGDWETFPVLYLTGPMDDPVITNTTTGKILDMTGTTINAGEVWTIDLRFGRKAVRDHNGALQNAALSDESDLLTWSLVPDPDAPNGINTINVSVPSSATTASQIRTEYYNRYPSLG